MNLQQAAWLKKVYTEDPDPDFLKVVAWREHQEIERTRDRHSVGVWVRTVLGWLVLTAFAVAVYYQTH